MDNIKRPHECRPSCRRLCWPQIVLLTILLLTTATIAPTNGPLLVGALYPYRILKNSSELITLTPEEWTSEYECKISEAPTQLTSTNAPTRLSGASSGQEPTSSRNGSSWPNVCYREPTAWRFHFVDELLQPFRLLVHESSIDERLSDTLYTASSLTGLNFNHYRYNSGEGRDVDLRNERLVAGAKVNDQLCWDQLRQMLGQIEDMRAKLDSRRHLLASDSGTAGIPAIFAASQPPPKVGLDLDHRHFRLARVLDSYGRYESGHLSGRHHSFGIYDQCIGTQLALSASWPTAAAPPNGATNHTGNAAASGPNGWNKQVLVNSRYCWASLSLDRYLSEPLAHRKRFDTEQDNFGIHVGVCVPEACHSKSFNPNQLGNREIAGDTRQLLQQIIQTQFRLPETMYLQPSLELDRVFCLVDSDSQWARMPLAGRILLACLASWALLLAFATYKRRHKHTLTGDTGDKGDTCVAGTLATGTVAPIAGSSKARHRRSLLKNLDLFESWCEFIGARDTRRSGPIDLDTLNPLKFVASLLVVLVHAGLIVGPLTATPIQTVANLERSRPEMLLLTGFILIDTFFVISALLLTYISLKKLLRLKMKRHSWRRQQQLQLRLNGLDVSGHAESAISGDNEHHEDDCIGKNGAGKGAIGLALSLAASDQHDESGVAPPTNHAAKVRVRPRVFGLDFLQTWAFITLYRYFRLVPLYFLVFWFKKSVFNYLGSGPLWDYGLNSDTSVGGCRQETWLTPISFMSAYLQATKQCLPQGWSISNDLFFNLVAPPLIVLFFKRPKWAKWLAPVLVVLGLVAGFCAYYSVDPRYRYELEQVRFYGAIIMFNVASHMYTNPIYRIPAFVIGIMGGYALYRYEQWGTHELVASGTKGGRQRHHHNPEWPSWFRRIATPAALATSAIATVVSFMTIELKHWLGPDRRGMMAPLILVAYHAIWSVSNVIVFLRMVTDWKDSFVLRMASGKFWRVCSKLTYGLLLIHWDLLMYDVNTRHYTVTFSRSAYLTSFSLAYLVALILSSIIYVCIENPLDKLTKTYLLRA